MKKAVYSWDELNHMGNQRTFKGTAREAAFLLGGVGTGNISIGSRGELRDWEIFNKPGKGNVLPYTFFAVRVQEEGKSPYAKVLESEIQPPFSKSHGFGSGELAGLPRFKESEMLGEYPFVKVALKHDEMPVSVSLEAFNPLIPLNVKDSSIPCVYLKYRVKNISNNNVDVCITGSLCNPVGFNGVNTLGNLDESFFLKNINEYKEEKGLKGLYMYSQAYEDMHLRYGNAVIATTNHNVTYKNYWLDGGWWDGAHDFWDDFLEDGRLNVESMYEATGSRLVDMKTKVGSIGAFDLLVPGDEKEFLFIISWYFPNRLKSWSEDCKCQSCDTKTVKNYYTVFYGNSWDVAKYVAGNYEKLFRETKLFHDALFESTLPDYVIDALSSNIVALRSPTCFILQDGTFLGWEGCHDKSGCCEGTCTHVWNYAQTVAFLFPELEKSARKVEFGLETDDEGKMAFRTHQVFGNDKWDFHPAADGQMGTIIRLYREWKLSGDNDFLKSLWPKAKNALEFAFKYWDSDGDFVLDNQQHNTYDIEFYGPNSLVNSMFFAALKAASEMALAMGDHEASIKYKNVFETGSKRMDEMLWGGEYYIQRIDDVNKYKYQYGTGCLSDQLLGQMMSHVAGLGYILPEEHVKKAVKSVFEHNFLEDFSNHHNVQRTYSLNDEKGLLLCTWPFGGRPRLPFVYSDEVWTGIEYQVAAHLIYEGFVNEGLTIVKAVRERHDGVRRNPWNEVECGHHYARAMSSWALLTALSGYKCDLVKGVIEFNPVINAEDFSCFFSCGKAWGVYRQKFNKYSGKYEYGLDILYGSLDGAKIIANECYEVQI